MSPSGPQRAAHLARPEPAHTGGSGTCEQDWATASSYVSELPIKAAGDKAERFVKLPVEVPAEQRPFCAPGQGAGLEEQGGMETDRGMYGRSRQPTTLPSSNFWRRILSVLCLLNLMSD